MVPDMVPEPDRLVRPGQHVPMVGLTYGERRPTTIDLPRQVANLSYVAHDSVMQLGITLPSAEKDQAAAAWDLESTFASGQAEQKQDSRASAVDAVMAMLEKE